MSFRHALDSAFEKGKAKLNEFQANNNRPPVPARPHSNQPPPVPTSSKPGSSAPAAAYWQPNLNASRAVTEDFRHELGDHGWGNNESQNYTNNPANSFYTPDGKLVVRAIADSNQQQRYTSARLTSHQTLSRPRGFLSVSIQAPCASGIWPAFWLLPADPFVWPTDGEVDIFESWNGDLVNHSCLHWGFFNGEDWNKHRVVETHVPSMPHSVHNFGFAWNQDTGKLLWYIDGAPVMKANIPPGTRPMADFRLIINVAMGGNVCGGKLPDNGHYDLVLSDLKMVESPAGGWDRFEQEWNQAQEGKAG
ncbi:concanavalin A-like lectin/glucanase [Lophium mytilinum]|uniref:Concanavalin A-like lectin/glucanase n=1 Tax=Lophium mytilinum TaxID=390894 RepID=A0A6A6QX04_9PEZI|nr:concanavalin A-like lectin/glucanase [Lophium mytilinum]